MPSHSLDALRRRAKALKKAFDTGEVQAIQRVRAELGSVPTLRRADALHVIALEQHFESWPKLKLAAETQGLDRAARQQRLKVALHHGQNNVVRHLLDETPDLAEGLPGLQIALLNRPAVEDWLRRRPEGATADIGGRRPIHFLAFSRWVHARPDLSEDMLAIAGLLVAHGADVNEAWRRDGRPLSPLFGAIGHANNLRLAEWLLDHGADPDDNESLYHAAELRNPEAIRLLLSRGARVAGTNALPRALDFNDHAAVRLMLAAGGDVLGPGGTDIAALPHAARRMCDADMILLLLDHGADPDARLEGRSAHAIARVHGNRAAARVLAEAGADTTLDPVEALLAAAADDRLPADPPRIDPEGLPRLYRSLVRDLIHIPGTLPHLKRLVRLGLEWDRPDAMGIPPVQIAAWEGLPETLAFLLSLGPDLTRVNGHGGTLLTTTLHGAENNPNRAGRDYQACLRLVLEAGLPLPAAALAQADDPEIAGFLSDWAEAHPDQVAV